MKSSGKIILVRHGESQSNKSIKILDDVADHNIQLTDKGRVQAEECVGDILEEMPSVDGIITSPYLRTKETTTIIKNKIGGDLKIVESVLLSEQMFGAVYSASIKNYKNVFPDEYNNYIFLKNNNGRFWAKPHLGESKLDLCIRSNYFIKSINPEANIIVVTHGGNINAIMKEFYLYDVEWFNKRSLPGNCEVITLLQKNRDTSCF